MQQGRDPANHLETDECREHEDVEGREQVELHLVGVRCVFRGDDRQAIMLVSRSSCHCLSGLTWRLPEPRRIPSPGR